MPQKRKTIWIKVSAKMARLEFNGCDPSYIKEVCHASCCDSSIAETGTLISIHPTEAERLEAHGAVVHLNLLQPRPGERKCMFKDKTSHLCLLHKTPDKPFGCIASPFMLTKKKTLIIRNRYKLLKCYKDGRRLPAYVAFRTSLDLILGPDEAKRVCNHLRNGGGDVKAEMPTNIYHMLKDNEKTKAAIRQRGQHGR